MAKRVGVDKWLFFTTLRWWWWAWPWSFPPPLSWPRPATARLTPSSASRRCWALLGVLAMVVLMRVDYRRYNSKKFIYPVLGVTSSCWWRLRHARLACHAIAGFASAASSPSSRLRSPNQSSPSISPGSCTPGSIHAGLEAYAASRGHSRVSLARPDRQRARPRHRARALRHDRPNSAARRHGVALRPWHLRRRRAGRCRVADLRSMASGAHESLPSTPRPIRRAQASTSISPSSPSAPAAGPAAATWKACRSSSICPKPHTDFIFANIAEELGFLGAILILLLFVVLGIRGTAHRLSAARSLRAPAGIRHHVDHPHPGLFQHECGASPCCPPREFRCPSSPRAAPRSASCLPASAFCSTSPARSTDLAGRIPTHLRILIAGGGTGGHIIPALAVARELVARTTPKFSSSAQRAALNRASFPMPASRSNSSKSARSTRSR